MNLRPFINFTIILAVVALFTSCGKSQVGWMFYDETRCADPWTFTNSNEQLKDNVKSHCKTQGITIYEIEIFTVQDPETCGDCHCRTGRQFKCKIDGSDVDKARDLRFYEK